MKHSFEIKLARPENVAEMHAIDLADWGEDGAATREQMQRRIEVNPYGNGMAINKDGDVLGSVWSNVIDATDYKTWLSCTGNGVYENFTPFGETGFGVNLSVRADAHGLGLGRALICWNVAMMFLAGRKHWRFGGRIPEYHKWAEVFTPEDYIRLYRAKEGAYLYFMDAHDALLVGPKEDALGGSSDRVDPREWKPAASGGPLPELSCLDGELEFFRTLRGAANPTKIYAVRPDYFPRDEKSLGYGVIMGDDNPESLTA